MIAVNALNFAVQTDDFANHVRAKQINPNGVNSVLIKHFVSSEFGHAFKIYFDYGLEAQSDKDLVLNVRILGENSFQLI